VSVEEAATSVSDPFRGQAFPVGALIGAAALIGFALLAVTAARLTGIGQVETPPAAAVESRELRFEDRADGAVLVFEGTGALLVDVVEPESGGFVRGVLRALARERRSYGSAQAEPFRLARRADGSLTLEDLATGRLINLEAFGSTNEAAFARLLSAGEAPR
jgi:putative photosynthetic complex assembly protein